MKNKQITAIILSATMVMAIATGCKKEESEEPLVLYYNQGQEEEAAITFRGEETPEQHPEEGEVLAPILAPRNPTEATAAAEPTEVTEAAQTTPETTAPQAQQTQQEQNEQPAETTTAQAAATATPTTAPTQAPAQNDASTPTPISTSAHIYDGAGVIADEGSVNSAMSAFQGNTGVDPAIFTIRDSLSGDDFRQYARNLYDSNFSDQDHVLVVYQLNPQGCWSWTVVFGTNTGTVFTQDVINSFQSDLTTAFSSTDVDDALVDTFNNAEQNAHS